MTSEKDLERELAKRVKKLGGWAIKLLPFLEQGLPDRLCLFPGARVAFAEVKSTGKKPSKMQKLTLKRLAALGFHVAVIDSLETLKIFLEPYK